VESKKLNKAIVDQNIPEEKVSKRSPSSQVYDFSFDFNLNLARRDTNNTIMRLDFSNVAGYWDSLVDSPGIQSRDLSSLDDRFFAPTPTDWSAQTLNTKFREGADIQDYTSIDEDLSTGILWATTKTGQCSINGLDYTEGVAAWVEGTINSTFYYGFSMIVSLISHSRPSRPTHLSQLLAGATQHKD
jgi:chitinase